MDLWRIVAGGTAIGLLAACWDYVKAFFWRVVNLFIQQIEIPTEPGHEAIISHLIARYKRSRIYDRVYGAWWEYRRDGRYGLVPYEWFGQRSMIFWDGWAPFVFSNRREQRTNANNQNSGHSDATKIYSTITMIRGTLDIDELFRVACEERNRQTWFTAAEEEEGRNRFVIHYVPKRPQAGENEENGGWSSSNNGLPWYAQGHYRLIGVDAQELGKARASGRALDCLIFPPRIKNLLQEIELWRKSRSWYQEKGLPWKRGWLLYGPPGTGKTALARAFAEDLNLPIYVFNLAEMSNHDLLRSWTEMQVNVPCIALIEDIDNVFHGRENVARKNMPFGMMPPTRRERDDDKGHDRPISTPLTFDCLLNCLDGVERSDGVFTIITTNDIAKIDPALGQPRTLPDGTTEFISTRPGRIDKAVELSYMESADKKRLAQRILSSYPDEFAAMCEFIERFPDLQETPAQFQERCGQVALKRFWAEQEKVTVPRDQIAAWSRPSPRDQPLDMVRDAAPNKK